MKNIEEFVDFSVKIEKQGNGQFGYFPFHAFVENADGKIDVICIAGVNGVEDCYKLIAKYMDSMAQRIYMALDFPAGLDMKNDFVVVFEIQGTNFNVFAIPYNNIDGTIYERINRSQGLIHIVENLKDVVLKSWR